MRALDKDPGVDDQQIGGVIRAVRIRRRWRQLEVAMKAGVSQSTVSRIERGHLAGVRVDALRGVAAALEIRIEWNARWRGGELDRLRNAGHSALHESVARSFKSRPQWTFAPEVSFSEFGERGVIDILAWNRTRRALLVIELKTAIVDVNELVGTFDRKIRLGHEVARKRGWAIENGTSVSGWVIVSDTRTNRRRLGDHHAMLRAAYPSDGRMMRTWLRDPSGPTRCLGFWPVVSAAGQVTSTMSPRRRLDHG